MKNSLLKIALASTAITLASPTFAEQSGWYVGIGFGQSTLSDWISKSDSLDALDAVGSSLGVVAFNGTVSSSSDDTGTAWKVFGGYSFNDNFALEASYIDLGEVNAKSTAVGDFSLDGSTFFPGSMGVKFKGESKALTFDAVGQIKLNPQFDLFAKVGAYNAHSKLKTTVILTDSTGELSGSDSISDNNTNIHLGLGANGWVTDNLGVRLEWEMFKKVKTEDLETDINVVSASLIYKF